MVSVVGTLLALLVFFALFGIFLTQYVPIWMSDNEAAFTAGLQASFADLKSNIEQQVSDGLVNGASVPASLSTPFVLASQGIPLIAQPTTATLNYVPRTQGVYINVSMQYGPGGKPNFYQNISLGTVAVSIPNRYYNPGGLEYEDDAVIQTQGPQSQLVLYPPPFEVNATGSHRSGTLGIVQLYGNATQLVSAGTVEAFTHFANVQEFPSTGSIASPGTPFRVNIVIGTLFPCAWATYLNSTLSHAGLGSGAYTLSPSTCVAGNGNSVPVKVQLNNFSSFDLILGSFTIVIGIGVS